MAGKEVLQHSELSFRVRTGIVDLRTAQGNISEGH